MSDPLPEPKYGIVPAELILSGLDDMSFRLYAYLDLRQGTVGEPAHGAQNVADAMRWQARTVLDHARLLSNAGLIELENDPGPRTPGRRTTGRAQPQVVFRVIHNPPRKRVNPKLSLPDPPGKKWRRPSKNSEGLARASVPTGRESKPAPRVAQSSSQVTSTSPPLPEYLESPAPDAWRQKRAAHGVSSSERAPRATEMDNGPALRPAHGVSLAAADENGPAMRQTHGVLVCDTCGDPFQGHTFDHEPTRRRLPEFDEERSWEPPENTAPATAPN